MANSNFETFRQGGEAADQAAEGTGKTTEGLYDQAKAKAVEAKAKAADAYDSAATYAGEAVSRAGEAAARVRDSVVEFDEMASEQAGRHPKAILALGVVLGFALGVLYVTSRSPEPSWRDYIRMRD
jgi:hypothetical protein